MSGLGFFSTKDLMGPAKNLCCIPNKVWTNLLRLRRNRNTQVLLHSFRLHALTSLNRIWELHWLRAVCMSMNIKGSAALFAPASTANEHTYQFPQFSKDCIHCDIARKKTAQALATIYKPSHYAEIRRQPRCRWSDQ